MTTRRLAAASALSLWTVALVLLAGPVRWELGHHYGHLVGEAIPNLPRLTMDLALPVLGVGPSSFGATVVFWLVWALVLAPPVALLVAVLRAQEAGRIGDLLLFGGAVALGLQGLVFLLVAVGLWLPFALL